MAEGTSTYMGMAAPLSGCYEQKQVTAATDMVTLTGTTSMSGDYMVFQDVSGNELAYIDCYGHFFTTLKSSDASAITITVTSTGALAETATNNAIQVNASSKSVLNSIIGYNSGFTNEVGTCNSFALFHGSKAPTYLLSVGGSQVGLGAATTNGFFVASLKTISAPSTAIAVAGLKMLAGTKAYYIVAYPDTALA